ncbi:hypothetical protein [Candidatus Paracaedibacter symbiosus]|uniref:hypothetical protein n=1 Tax=Candidatus Paracaedibacter symbiosus TaxID=244582 RepID=UPI0005099772|nr:hypothetical protein [Candidatus Paracaedibacter symbiosus]
MTKLSLEKTFTKTAPPVETLLLICEKCGKKQIQADQENPSSLLQKSLKLKIRESLKPGTARVITTSCMNICPIDAIAIGHIDALPGNTQAQFYLLHEKDIDAATTLLFDQFLERNQP